MLETKRFIRLFNLKTELGAKVEKQDFAKFYQDMKWIMIEILNE